MSIENSSPTINQIEPISEYFNEKNGHNMEVQNEEDHQKKIGEY